MPSKTPTNDISKCSSESEVVCIGHLPPSPARIYPTAILYWYFVPMAKVWFLVLLENIAVEQKSQQVSKQEALGTSVGGVSVGGGGLFLWGGAHLWGLTFCPCLVHVPWSLGGYTCGLYNWVKLALRLKQGLLQKKTKDKPLCFETRKIKKNILSFPQTKNFAQTHWAKDHSYVIPISCQFVFGCSPKPVSFLLSSALVFRRKFSLTHVLAMTVLPVEIGLSLSWESAFHRWNVLVNPDTCWKRA